MRESADRSAATAQAVVMRGITKRFPGVVALEDVGLEVCRGELHAICGENGAGKSTLMKILSGVYPPDEGGLEIGGQPVIFASTKDAEQAGIAIIHQELALVEDLSVAANVFLGREKRTPLGLLDDRAMHNECRRLLAILECHVAPGTRTGSLRVGDQQLVEIAKALSLEASIVVMDEPTSALTESESARLERTIARLLANGTTILYISHKMDEVFRMSAPLTAPPQTHGRSPAGWSAVRSPTMRSPSAAPAGRECLRCVISHSLGQIIRGATGSHRYRSICMPVRSSAWRG